MRVTISGTSYGEVEGGSLFQTERPHIWRAFESRKAGYGYQYVAELTSDDAEALWECLDGYSGLLFGGGTDDDAEARRQARALRRDADRLAKQLDG